MLVRADLKVESVRADAHRICLFIVVTLLERPRHDESRDEHPAWTGSDDRAVEVPQAGRSRGQVVEEDRLRRLPCRYRESHEAGC